MTQETTQAAQPQEQTQMFNLALSVEQINAILKLLGKRKCDEVFALVYTIHAQVAQQVQQAQMQAAQEAANEVSDVQAK